MILQAVYQDSWHFLNGFYFENWEKTERKTLNAKSQKPNEMTLLIRLNIFHQNPSLRKKTLMFSLNALFAFSTNSWKSLWRPMKGASKSTFMIFFGERIKSNYVACFLLTWSVSREMFFFSGWDYIWYLIQKLTESLHRPVVQGCGCQYFRRLRQFQTNKIDSVKRDAVLIALNSNNFMVASYHELLKGQIHL